MGRNDQLFRSAEQKKQYLSSYEAVMSLWPCPYEERYIDTASGCTHVTVAGEEGAPPLVLFHGIGASSTMWYPNVGALAKRFRIYAVDSIGDFGKSEPAGPLTDKQTCTDWIREVLDGLRLEQPYLAGQSMGGWLAAIFAAAHPNRCKALILLAPVATVAKVKLNFFLHMYPAVLFRSRSRIAKLLQWCHAPVNRPHTLFKEQFIRGFQSATLLLRAIPTVMDQVELARLPRTLVIVGSREVIYDPHLAVRNAEAAGLETCIIPMASHCLTSEQPKQVNAAIIRFLLENQRYTADTQHGKESVRRWTGTPSLFGTGRGL